MSYIYWNVHPELMDLGPLEVRWYGLMFALLLWLGFIIVQWQFRTEQVDVARLNSLLVYIVAGTFIGARLAHCLFYEPSYYLAHPLEILKIWKGGLASHGGAVGILVALALYSRRHTGLTYLWLLDRIAVPAALSGALIRIGNLFNSEIVGRPADVPWAFVFARVDALPRHPVQLYEAAAYLLVFLLLLQVYRHFKSYTPKGMLIGLLLVPVFSARFLLEFVKTPQADFDHQMPFSVGQLLSIPFVLLGLALFWSSLRTRSVQPSYSCSSP